MTVGDTWGIRRVVEQDSERECTGGNSLGEEWIQGRMSTFQSSGPCFPLRLSGLQIQSFLPAGCRRSGCGAGLRCSREGFDWRETSGAEGAEAQGVVALGQALTVGVGHQRGMVEGRRDEFQSPVQEQLPRGRGQ